MGKCLMEKKAEPLEFHDSSYIGNKPRVHVLENNDAEKFYCPLCAVAHAEPLTPVLRADAC